MTCAWAVADDDNPENDDAEQRHEVTCEGGERFGASLNRGVSLPALGKVLHADVLSLGDVLSRGWAWGRWYTGLRVWGLEVGGEG